MKVPRRKISKVMVLEDSIYSRVPAVLRQSILVEAVYHGEQKWGREQGQHTCQALLSVTSILLKPYFLKVP